MNGRTLDLSIETNSGIILGDDGNRYSFVGAEWKEAANPARGMRVDFEVRGSEAVAIYRALEISAAPVAGISAGAPIAAGNLRAYVVSRLLIVPAMLLVLTLVVFTLGRVVPGDPAVRILDGDGGGYSQRQLERLREKLGTDKPLPVEYLVWVGKMLKGDFGTSYFYDTSVSDDLFHRLSVTLSLLPLSVFFAALIAIPLGVLAIAWRGTGPLDRVAGAVLGGAAALAAATPVFWLAIMLILFLVLLFGWLPPLGYASLWDNPWTGLQQLFWPSLVLAIPVAAGMIRVIRSGVLESGDGAGTMRAILCCLGNLLISGPTLFAGFLAGAIVVEVVFLVPGIGRLAIEAAVTRDFPVLQGVAMLTGITAALVVGVSLGAGLLLRPSKLQAEPRPTGAANVGPDAPGFFDASESPWNVLNIIIPLGVIGIVFLVAAAATAGPDPVQTSVQSRLMPPGFEHLLGTDHLGRDVLGRLLFGARVGLLVALASLIPVGMVGGGLGLASALLGGKADTIIMGVVDKILAFPAILIAILVMAALGASLVGVVIAATLALWPRVARATRDEALAIKAGGFNPLNLLESVMAVATLHIALAILLEATLSFLGLGTPPPTPSWGGMLAGVANFRHGWWVAVFPGLALAAVTIPLIAFPFKWSKI